MGRGMGPDLGSFTSRNKPCARQVLSTPVIAGLDPEEAVPVDRDTLLRASGRNDAAGTSGIVVVAHGGRSVSRAPTSAFQLSVLRMVPVARAIGRAVRGDGIEVRRPRFRLRGWNGADASPVRDLTELLDQISAGPWPVPVVLIGHSMGARAALRAAGHPLVCAVAGLAPWLPPGEPAEQLAGRRVLLVHGSADRVCDPRQTWAYAEHARSAGQVAAIEVRGSGHGMLRRARLWHQIAAEFARLSLPLPAGQDARSAGQDARSAGQDARSAGQDARSAGQDARSAGQGPVAEAFARAAAGQGRLVL
jgi:pimeloyl-ACP methyl ester carboxylesterase